MPNNDYVKREDIFPAVTKIAKEIVFGNQDDDKVVDIINSIPAADVEPKQKWISVTERLPEDDTIVLVVSLLHHKPYPAFQIGGVWYDSFLVACQMVIGMDDEETIDDSGITHWMPLPEPPKGD